MNTREIAQGGMLAGMTVALLYAGGLSVQFGATACMIAGVSSAVPLLRHARLRESVLLYAVSGVLALLLVPRKKLVLGYMTVCGLYPILKYGIECYIPRRWQLFCKLAYGNLVFAVVVLLLKYGLLAAVVLPAWLYRIALWPAANVIFVLYDIGLSRLIAALRKRLPPG